MNKKILIITYYFPPGGGSGVQRWLKFIKYLPAFGIAPIVLTVNEDEASYPQLDYSLLQDIPEGTRIERTRTKEILRLYKKLSPDKGLPQGGFSTEKAPSLFQRVSRFIRGNFFLPDPRRGWNKYAFGRACELIEKENIKTVITTSPPHSTQLIGLMLKERFPDMVWIADLRDPWTDIFYYKELYPTVFADMINRHYEKTVLEKADKIIVTSEATKKTFLRKSNRLDATKISVITNGFDPDDFNHIQAENDNRFIITYIGVLYNSDDIKGFLGAFEKRADKKDFCLRFVGQSSEVVRPLLNEHTTPFVELLPAVPHPEAVALMCRSNMLVLLIPRGKKEAEFLPGKLFEYLATGNPILCLSESDSEAGKIINACQAGKVTGYNDMDAIQDFINKLKEKDCPESNDSNIRCKQYSRKELTKKLVDLIL